MATLQRSAVSFRRQGSSGIVWDDKYFIGEDGKIGIRELRPCQTVREGGSVSNIAAAAPTTCPRSLSTPATNYKVFGANFLDVKLSRKLAAAEQKSKSA